MANIIDAFRGQLSPEILAELQLALDQREYDVGRQDLNLAGTVNLTQKTTVLNIDGTVAYTLADGTDGQVKTILCVTAINTPAGTLTPANYGNGATILFNAVGETVTLEFRSGSWWHTALEGATPA